MPIRPSGSNWTNPASGCRTGAASRGRLPLVLVVKAIDSTPPRRAKSISTGSRPAAGACTGCPRVAEPRLPRRSSRRRMIQGAPAPFLNAGPPLLDPRRRRNLPRVEPEACRARNADQREKHRASDRRNRFIERAHPGRPVAKLWRRESAGTGRACRWLPSHHQASSPGTRSRSAQ